MEDLDKYKEFKEALKRINLAINLKADIKMEDLKSVYLAVLDESIKQREDHIESLKEETNKLIKEKNNYYDFCQNFKQDFFKTLQKYGLED